MIHENIRKIRSAKGVTQKHLAECLNISSMAYSRMERGESKIDAERLRNLAKCLSVNIEVFFNVGLTESVISSLKKKREVV